MLVPLVVLVLGTAAVVVGALVDRRRRARALAALTGAPDREIPGFRPTHDPRYVLADAAHQRSAPLATDSVPLAADRGEEVPYGMVRAGLATHEGGLMVLDAPRVLLLADPAASVADLLPLLAERARAPHALVIVAPNFSDEVADLFEVNVLQHYLVVGAVAIDEQDVRDHLATLTGAVAVDPFDLAAGYVPETSLGRCDRWISDSSHSWIARADPQLADTDTEPRDDLE